jgi:2-polyprenyl-6-methoxyphenol hydroxylase-like FAD-dependent oxidoreductase
VPTTYIIGAGPVGLATAALLQRTSQEDNSADEIVVFEKRPTYTRSRKVTLSPLLLAEDFSDYVRADGDADDIRAVFSPSEIDALMASKRAMPEEFRDFLRAIGSDFVPLNVVESGLSELVDAGRPLSRRQETVTLESLEEVLLSGDTVLDCSGRNSLTRDGLRGDDNTVEFVLEHALVATFAIDGDHLCDEACKRSGSIGNEVYDFIPSVQRSYSLAGLNYVVGIIEITEDDFARLPRELNQDWLDSGDPVAQGINRFLDHHAGALDGEAPSHLTLSTLPLNLYRAQRFTNADDRRFGGVPDVSVKLLGDAAIGSPYFQSISLGLECAIYLAWLRSNSPGDVMHRFETFMDRQWLRVYMRSKSIKYNKDVLTVVDDIPRLLDMLTVY